MIRKFCFAFTLLLLFSCKSQNTVLNSDDYLDLTRTEFTGDLAYETTAFVEKYWRVAGNKGFNESVYWIEKHLKKAGFILEKDAKPDDVLTYRIEKRPLKNPTWEPVSASLHIAGENTPLLVSETNRNMTYLNSVSTPNEGVTAEVVVIENLEDIASTSLEGKIVFIEKSIWPFYKTLVEKNVLGVITYNNPAYLQPEKNTTSIQFRSLPPQLESKLWGIALSYEAKERLKAALEKGENKVQVKVKTKIYPSEELTIVADVKGSKAPEERIVFSAHIQEPGANDNATGVGVQLEMASVVAGLVKNNKVSLNRTMTFLWGDEIVSTRRYIEDDKKRASKIKWGVSLDMVGENTSVTGGSFLIEKMPDPSAIWTRGKDKHSEWGGEVLSPEDMKPHYLNDLIISNFKKQGKFANWEVNTNPFEGGSDHMPFLNANIPGLLLWHFTDQFYHTDNDRIDKVSKETLKNVATGALASGLQLVNSNTKTAISTLENLLERANNRISDEFELSKIALENGSEFTEEKAIIVAWEGWYKKAFETVKDMSYSENVELNENVEKAQKEIEFNVQQILNKLKS